MAELQKRFILARESAWNAEGFNKSLYNDSIVFIHNGTTNEEPGKCVAIYAKGVEYPVGEALSGKTITKAFAGDGTVTYTTTGKKLDGTNASITALSFKEGDNIEVTVDASGALVITGKDWTTDINDAVANKNVTASGDTYVDAIVEKGTNHVTVSATKEITDAVGYADSALQTLSGTSNDYVQASFAGKSGENGAKTDVLTVELTSKTITSLGKADTAVQSVVTGATNGTIKVDNTEVAVAGLGSAAYTESSAYDAAGAASTVKTELLGGATEGTTLKSLSDAIANVSADAKSYSIAAVTEGLGTNVKEAFKLVDEDGTQVGATINIYKDSSLISIALVDADAEGNAGQFLKYTYVLATGEEQVVYVDANKFLVESEFKNGLQVSDAGEVSIKLAEGNENYLTVDENGLKLSGIDTAISTAIADLDGSATATENTTEGIVNVLTSVVEVDGIISRGAETAVATATYVDKAIEALDATIYANNASNQTLNSAHNGLMFDSIQQIDGKITDGNGSATTVKYVDQSQLTNLATSKIKYTGVTNTDTISQAIEKMDAAWEWGTI